MSELLRASCALFTVCSTGGALATVGQAEVPPSTASVFAWAVGSATLVVALVVALEGGRSGRWRDSGRTLRATVNAAVWLGLAALFAGGLAVGGSLAVDDLRTAVGPIDAQTLQIVGLLAVIGLCLAAAWEVALAEMRRAAREAVRAQPKP